MKWDINWWRVAGLLMMLCAWVGIIWAIVSGHGSILLAAIGVMIVAVVVRVIDIGVVKSSTRLSFERFLSGDEHPADIEALCGAGLVAWLPNVIDLHDRVEGRWALTERGYRLRRRMGL